MSANALESKGGQKPAFAKKMSQKEKKRLLYYIAIIALPVLQFCIFYIGVNFSSIMLAFSKGEITTGSGYKIHYFQAGFDNFVSVFEYLAEIKAWKMIRNSLIVIGTDLVISLPLAVLFSFYIYKNYRGAKFFQVILFLPQIVSTIIFSILYKLLTQDVISEVLGISGGWLKNPDTTISFVTILVYNIWISFGVNVVMMTGAMSGIDHSLSEAAALDGATNMQEFWYITLPLIWSTFTTFVIVSLTGLFTNQFQLFGLFSSEAIADVSTFGYQMFIAGQSASHMTQGYGAFRFNFFELSALGLACTAIILPIVFGVRRLMNKIGPSVS